MLIVLSDLRGEEVDRHRHVLDHRVWGVLPDYPCWRWLHGKRMAVVSPPRSGWSSSLSQALVESSRRFGRQWLIMHIYLFYLDALGLRIADPALAGRLHHD